MNRNQRILSAILVVELAVGAVLCFRQGYRPTAPIAELSVIDPLAAGHIRALARQCRSPADWARLGDAYLAYGYFPEGEACYRQAVEDAPEPADLAYEWAFALERIGRNEAANREYERAIRQGHPRPGDCWYYIGRNWLRLEQAEQAREAFRKAGDHPLARYELARLLVRSGQPEEAISVLDRLTAEHPKAVQPYLLRYRIEALRDSPLAAVYADRAWLAPDVLPSPWEGEKVRLDETHERLGVAGVWSVCQGLLAQGQLAEAEPRLRHALQLHWDPAGVDLLAKVVARRGQLGESIYLLQQVLDREGPSGHFLIRLGDMYEQSRRFDLAGRAWSRAVQLGLPPGAKYRDYPYQKLAAYSRQQGDKDASGRHSAGALYAAGHEAFWNQKLPEARTALERAVELAPGMAHAWFYLGETRRLLGEAGPAQQAYQRCREINPDHGRALASLVLLERPLP
jgi:tetratricopeptide (TPR) repeat protein